MVDVIARIATDLTQLDPNVLYDSSATIWRFTPTPGSSTANLRSLGLGSWAMTFVSVVDSAVGAEWAVSGGLADSYFFGSGITLSNTNVITGGTLNYLIATVGGRLALAIDGLNLSAATVYHAVTSANTTDDLAVLRVMFSGADTFTMSAQADKVMGYAGNDLIKGNGGDDTLNGSLGNDSLIGGDGADKLVGGDGIDRLLGGVGNDRLDGSAGNDMLNGGADNDSLIGGGGADTLVGGDGIDRLLGGAERDMMTGGAGADLFIFKAIVDTGATGATADVITDFNSGSDRIVLSGIDASTVLDGNNAFEFLGTATAGTSAAGAVRYVQIDNDGTAHDFTIVYLDTDADPAAEGILRFRGLIDFTAADFVL